MTLQVPFEQFAPTVGKILKTKDVFVTSDGAGSIITAADLGKSAIVLCVTEKSVAEVKKTLEALALVVLDGVWTLDGQLELSGMGQASFYLAAVSYSTGFDKPGVWVDAYPSCPNELQVLREVYDEFIETGELGDTSFEEFLRLAAPNVVIISPAQIQGFLADK